MVPPSLFLLVIDTVPHCRQGFVNRRRTKEPTVDSQTEDEGDPDCLQETDMSSSKLELTELELPTWDEKTSRAETTDLADQGSKLVYDPTAAQTQAVAVTGGQG